MEKQRTRIAIPVVGYDGIHSVVSGHFGRARGFIVADSGGGELTYLDTAKARRASECAPVQALIAAGSRVVVAKSMGRGALQRCHQAGMRILLAVGGTVGEVLESYRREQCPDFPDSSLCEHHTKDAHDHGHHGRGHGLDCRGEEGLAG